jgi:MFS family permease
MHNITRGSSNPKLIAVLALAFGVVVFDRNAMGFVGPFVAADLRLSNTELGVLSASTALTWSIACVLIGALSDAIGRRRALLIGSVIIFSFCSVLSGLATSFAVLLASRLLMVFADGGVLPIAQALIALDSPAEHRGRNAGIVQNAGAFFMGAFLAPLLLVWIANHYGWRSAFFLAAAPGFVCAALLAAVVRAPAARETRPAQQAPAAAQAVIEDGGFWSLFKYRNVWLCIFISGAMVAWLIIGYVFLPVYYLNARHMSPAVMGPLMAVLGLSGTLFSAVVPGLSDRIGRKPVIVAFCAIGATVPLAAIYHHGPVWSLGLIAFGGWSASGAFPLFMATVPFESIPARYLGSAVGLTMGFGEATGGVLGPGIAGRVADRFGLSSVMFLMAGCALAGAAIAMFLRETAPRRGAPDIAA